MRLLHNDTEDESWKLYPLPPFLLVAFNIVKDKIAHSPELTHHHFQGHKNAISDECSSNDGSADSPSDGAGVADSCVKTPLSSSTSLEVVPTRDEVTKTVNQYNYDIPLCVSAPAELESSFNPEMSTYNNNTKLAAMTSLSSSLSRRGGWNIPAGAGLRGGAPLPGETSAMSNGTSGWGPPPTAGGSSGSGASGWGSAPAAAPSGAWGAPAQQPGQININNGEDNQNNSKMLNTMPQGPPAAPAAASSQATQGLVTTQPSPAPGPAAPAPSSWAAAAGKGLPPSEGANQGSNGTTNKQLEQLNSVREALFSQDGWGCQHVKQGTSWDVGASAGQAQQQQQPQQATAEPAAAAAAAPSGPSTAAPTQQPAKPPAADSMQWTPPGGAGRNDGTDLWRSTLSGVPQPPKPQPTTPWGNHTPANPADYKEWGRDDGSGAGGDGMPGAGPGDDSNMWTGAPGSGPGSSGSGGPGQTWAGGDQERQREERGQFSDREGGPNNWGGERQKSYCIRNIVITQYLSSGVPKPKDEGMGWGNNGAGSSQWGGAGGGQGGSNGAVGSWGPPPAKPGPGAGGWGNNPGPAAAPGGRPQWPENESPTMGRRFDDGGTGIWGGKAQSGMGPGGPPGGEYS